jgi:hypothetical protein
MLRLMDLTQTRSHGSRPRPDVEIRTSTRRRKTAGARWEGDKVVVIVPAHWSRATRDSVTENLITRILRTRPAVTASDEDLARRAGELADRYVGAVRPLSIRWVANQTTRWGSCTTSTGAIRISERLRSVPAWVLDSVVVHELAHLEHADHSPAFHELVNRFPRHAEAGIYLEGFGHGLAWRDSRADQLGGFRSEDQLRPTAPY